MQRQMVKLVRRLLSMDRKCKYSNQLLLLNYNVLSILVEKGWGMGDLLMNEDFGPYTV